MELRSASPRADAWRATAARRAARHSTQLQTSEQTMQAEPAAPEPLSDEGSVILEEPLQASMSDGEPLLPPPAGSLLQDHTPVQVPSCRPNIGLRRELR